MLDAEHAPVHHLFEAVDGQSDVLLFRRAVAGLAGRLIMRAEPDAAACLGLEVEAAKCVDDQRQIRRSGRIDPELRDRPAIGADAQRTRAGRERNRVGPGPGGVDQDVRLEKTGAGLQVPAGMRVPA
jgi:hypothetical protein